MINQNNITGSSRVRFQSKASVQTLPMRNTFHDSVSFRLSKLNQLNSKLQGLIQVTFLSPSAGSHNAAPPVPPGRTSH